ncbi:MAG: hypothetical protein NTY14_01150 [Candidatus Omnitrophica bacterium]|nr:hypothetical protein [Candidatus Omnitrophota bacterium]
MKAKKFFWGTTLAVLGISSGLLLAGQLNLSSVAMGQQQASKPEGVSSVGAATFEGFRMEDSVINVAGTTGKAVISITVEQV